MNQSTITVFHFKQLT